jgi:hypothetical protein
MRRFVLPTLFFITMMSCDNLDDRVVPVLGVYRSHVLGVAGPFDLVVGTNGNDDITIDAPFDGEFYDLIDVDLDDLDEMNKDIDIRNQVLAPGLTIKGDGFVNDQTIQIDYVLDFGNGDKEKLTIVGTKVR